MTGARNPREVTLTRTFDAPRDLVFKAWTEPEQVKQWWGPRHFTTATCELDVRPGGAFRIDMQDPNGNLYPNTGHFEEVVEPERLVVISRAFEDTDGNAGLEARQTVTFQEHEGKTTLTLHAVVLESKPEFDAAIEGMEEGWSQTLDKLGEYLETL